MTIQILAMYMYVFIYDIHIENPILSKKKFEILIKKQVQNNGEKFYRG